MRGGRRPDLLREVRKSTYTLLRTLSRETLKASHTATKFVAHAIADLASSSADEDWAQRQRQRQRYHNRSRTTKHDRSSRGFHNSHADNNDMYNDDFGDYSPEIGSRNPQPVGVMVRRYSHLWNFHFSCVLLKNIVFVKIIHFSLLKIHYFMHYLVRLREKMVLLLCMT
jgi:hypothetical protein